MLCMVIQPAPSAHHQKAPIVVSLYLCSAVETKLHLLAASIIHHQSIDDLKELSINTSLQMTVCVHDTTVC